MSTAAKGCADDAHVTAFAHWVDTLVEHAKEPLAVCAARVEGMYAKGASLAVEKDGEVILDVSGRARIGEEVCTMLSGLESAPNPLLWVEHCNGVWKGEFAPFADASKSALAMPADFLETTPRGFVVRGSLDDASNFVAQSERTCMGACATAPAWECGQSGDSIVHEATAAPAQRVVATPASTQPPPLAQSEWLDAPDSCKWMSAWNCNSTMAYGW